MAQASTGKATSMADLMKSAAPKLVTFKKGDLITGIISKLSPHEILVDIDAKTEAVVLEKDKKILRNLLSTLKVGSKVEVSVLNPESDFGYPVVSLRRFLGDIVWDRLDKAQKEHTPFEVTVQESTRGGLLVSTKEGMSGFLPNSHTLLVSSDNAQVQNLGELVGKDIKVYVLELNRQAHKIIFSQKPVMGTKEFEEAVKGLKVDQKIEVTIANITSFGIFVSVPLANAQVPSVDGLIHISQLAWEETSQISSSFQVGQKVQVVIIGFDKDAKRVDLSIKKLSADPFAEVEKHLTIDQKVTGTVKKFNSMGLLLELDTIAGIAEEIQPLEGLIRKDKIPPTVTYEEGQSVTATVSQIDKQKHRILLVPVLQAKPLGYR